MERQFQKVCNDEEKRERERERERESIVDITVLRCGHFS